MSFWLPSPDEIAAAHAVVEQTPPGVLRNGFRTIEADGSDGRKTLLEGLALARDAFTIEGGLSEVLFCLAHLQPFADGNKRTATLVASATLAKNRRFLLVTNHDLAVFIRSIQLGVGPLAIQAWLRLNTMVE